MNKKSSLFEQVENTVNKYNMISPGDCVVIGLSGGADSVFLMHFFIDLAGKYNLTLKCAHIEHGIRGKDSIEDCEFCRKICKENNIEFNMLSIDAPKEAAEAKMGVEEYSRNRRYEFFDSIQCDKIATAHNLSDNVETIIFKLIRGCSLKGAAGIPPKRGKIIRPLIETSGGDIRSWLNENSVQYRTDKTNFDNDYSRNYIRNSVVPLFSKVNDNYEEAFSRFAESALEDSKFLDELAEESYKKLKINNYIEVEKLINIERPLRLRVIAKFLAENGVKINNYNITGVENVLRNAHKFQLTDNLYAVSSNGYLEIKSFNNGVIRRKTFDFKKEIIGYSKFLNKCELLDKGFNFCCDYDKINGDIYVRSRIAGDSVALAGRNCTKSLKKLFNEMHIPPERRSELAVVTDDLGVMGVVGICVDERVAITKETKKVLILTLSAED